MPSHPLKRRHKKIPKQVEENAIKDAKDAKKKEGEEKLKDKEEEKRKQESQAKKLKQHKLEEWWKEVAYRIA